MTSHSCDAIVIACIDFRFQQHLDRWLDAMLGSCRYDRVGLAGGVKNWDVVMAQIEISVQLHQTHRVLLINHEDCGAYGAEGTIERHRADLQEAQRQITARFPGVLVELYYNKLDGSFERWG